MKVDLDELVDTGMIADRAGTRSSAVTNWTIRHPDFPAPVWTGTGRHRLWLWWQVKAWLEHTGRIAP